MTNIRLIVSISLLSFSTVCLHADVLTGNGSLQSWSLTVLGPSASPTTGGPFWNNVSGDGTAFNIGWCLTGSGNCHISNPPGALSYVGNSKGTAASNIGFTDTGIAQVATLDGKFTNQNGLPQNGTDIFGYYTLNSGIITTTALFNSTQALGTTATFTPTGAYGFYLENVQTAGLTPPNQADYFWFMNDSLNYVSGAATAESSVTQHFSVFSATNGYYIGMEDTPAATADFDYNDMIVGVQPAPEPTSLALIASGSGLLGWAIRRRRA